MLIQLMIYLNILFCDGLFVSLKSLAEFACSNSAIADFAEGDIFCLSLPATYAWRSYCPEYELLVMIV